MPIAARGGVRKPKPRFVVTAAPSKSARKTIRDGLIAYNREQAGRPPPWKALAVLLKDGRGRVIGGALGHSFWGWAYIELLWLPAEQRGKGHGSKLMKLAEAEARKRGCVGMVLNTASFQAPGFYPKLGFTVYAQIDDFPPGHKNFYLMKRLDPPHAKGG